MMGADTDEPIRFLYKFAFPNGVEKRFLVQLDPATFAFMPPADPPKPDWTRLNYQMCERCPLEQRAEHCPIAVNLAGLVEAFQDALSFEHTTVTVDTSERTYLKQTSLQKGLSSIIGIVMVTSNCPVMDRLRPAVRYHLPFATASETFYRMVSMYLTAQYFVMRRGGTPDWELQHLAEIYQDVAEVNRGMAKRLSQASSKDANVNAIIILATFGGSVGDFLEESLGELAPLFDRYLERP
jgi:hypothetical protein